MFFEEQSTTLYSDTGYEDDDAEYDLADDMETHAEPSDPNVTVPSEIPAEALAARMAMDGDETEISSSFERTQTTQSFGFGSSATRRTLAELSEEDAPSFIDVSTLDGPSPAIVALTSRNSQSPVPDARRSPVIPPALHTAEPASRRRPTVEGMAGERSERLPWLFLLGAIAVVVVTVLFTVSVLHKSTTSQAAKQSGERLCSIVEEHRISVLSAFDKQGVSRRELDEMWFVVEDAPADDRVEPTARFGAALVDRAEQLRVSPVVQTQLTRIDDALESWQISRQTADQARSSWIGSLTGSLGTANY